MSDTLYVAPGAPITAEADGYATGLAGTIGVRILSAPSGAVILARTTAGIVEQLAGSGAYAVTLTAPTTAGSYTIVWDDAGGRYATETLIVTASVASASVPLPGDFCTVADVAAELELGTDTTRYARIQTLISQASAQIQMEYDREFVGPGITPVTRLFRYRGNNIMRIGDAQTVTSLTIDTDTTTPLLLVAGTDYWLEPFKQEFGVYTHAEFNGLDVVDTPGQPDGRREVTIVGVYGFPSIPLPLLRGTVLTVTSWLDKASQDYASGDFAVDAARSIAPATRQQTYTIPGSARRTLAPLRLLSVG